MVRSILFEIEKDFLFQGRARGGRGNSNSMINRLPPSTHFVRPQPDTLSHSRPKLYSVNNHRATPVELELQRSYPTTLLRFYGTRNGQTINSNDYGNFRISMSLKKEITKNIPLSTFQNARYAMNNHRVTCPLLLIYAHISKMIFIILVHLTKTIVNVQYVMLNLQHLIKLYYIKIKNT